MPRLTDEQLAYALLRVAFGINLALHGVNRILGGVGHFAAKLAEDFAPTVLPGALVWPFGVALPFAELAIGVLLALSGASWSGAMGGQASVLVDPC